MIKLENIGFYTLSDKRAKNSSWFSPLYRCELIITGTCNFRCPYCRGIRKDIDAEISEEDALATVGLWVDEGLKNVRFSGGEPSLRPLLLEKLVKYCKKNGVNHIAISTNGSSSFDLYKRLIDCGVNDFSISLDSGCCSIGDIMAGGISGAWEKVVSNIEAISKIAYVSVGMVFTEDNVSQAVDSVLFADSLGVSDIRVISSAQYNKAIENISVIPEKILSKYKILNYRIKNQIAGIPMRGLDELDSHRCRLALDDMAVAGGYHFPCIIYLREGGDPIGMVGGDMRYERKQWVENHDCYEDSICRKNCLDVCVAYNNKAQLYFYQKKGEHAHVL